MNVRTRQGIIYFGTFSFFFLFMLYAHIWLGAIVFGACLALGLLIIIFPDAKVKYDDNPEDVAFGQSDTKPAYLTYYGDELHFAGEDIIFVLTKHSSYFAGLSEEDKKIFTGRLRKFIDDKTFRIHDSSGFREMPILISAAAIQLSFGLQKYLLPNFTIINIYPQEFMMTIPTIRFLEGNVSGHRINISWKYFLRGFELPADGDNVGLHEMAHAYYYQNFGPCLEKDDDFVEAFNEFNTRGNDVYQKLSQSVNGIYTDYAKKDFQEFWAESVEIFFERYFEMKNTYPLLYEAIADLLNQDPANKIT